MDVPILHRILYVDDEPSMLAVAQIVLEEEAGFTVEVCRSGEEAQAKGAAFRPDLILLDMQMPDMDGATTLGALRRIPALSATPVICITAAREADELARMKTMGVLDVIAKPFDPETLADTIDAIWSSRP